VHIPPSTFFLIWALFVTYNQRNQQQGYLKIYILHLGVTPLWGCHPVRSAPPHPPSDATDDDDDVDDDDGGGDNVLDNK